jgi:hypothetical protein
MFMSAHLGVFLVVFAVGSTASSAQQNRLPSQINDGKIHLDVVGTPKSGPPVRGLRQEDSPSSITQSRRRSACSVR